VELPDQGKDPLARGLGWIRRARLGAGERPQVAGQRSRVAILREAIVRRPLGAEESALDRDADSEPLTVFRSIRLPVSWK
jgi:hypothetical protein